MVADCAKSANRRLTPASPADADTELLYDQPYEDNKRLRVSGPFTVESLSPHRVLAPILTPRSQRQLPKKRPRRGSLKP